MWSREFIKGRAKNVLRFTYWKAFAVSLVILFAGGSHNGGGSGGNSGSRYRRDINNFGESIDSEVIINFAKVLIIISSIALILIVLRIFVGYMLEVGGRKYFIRAAEGDANVGYLGYSFRDGRYVNILLTMLLRSIFTFLWTLLLIIPGIIKSYAYRMVPYILADNPEIGHMRAIQLSNEMTRGEKLNIFVLDLSFIGWYLLGTLAFLVGVLFVLPYDDATNAELYLILRKDAIARGLTTYVELNLKDDREEIYLD